MLCYTADWLKTEADICFILGMFPIKFFVPSPIRVIEKTWVSVLIQYFHIPSNLCMLQVH